MSVTLGELNFQISRIAPPGVAEAWDNVGLQIGDPEAAIRKALVVLEVSPATLEECIELGATAMIAHHPLIFSPLKSIREDNHVAQMTARLIRAGIGLIVAHTNLDKSTAGPNYALADALQIKIEKWLRPDRHQEYVKVVVFTPEGYEYKVIDAIAAGGGGTIGNYSHCAFRAWGVGSFKPLEGADPFIGEIGKMEETKEARLETLVPRSALANVLREIRLVHPYEEPALDVMPVEIATSSSGLGIVGELNGARKLGKWKEEIDAAIRPLLPQAAQAHWPGCAITGELDRPVQRVAVCSGSGGSLIGDAAESGVDVLLTGEINHHAAIEARALGVNVICLGHFASEVSAMPFFVNVLRQKESGVELIRAENETDPLMSV